MSSVTPDAQRQQQNPSRVSQLDTGSISPNGYSFPRIFSFKPLFSKQPNVATSASQFRHWSTIVRGYCASHHIFILHASDLTPAHPLFHNAQIKRRCPPDLIRQIIAHLATTDHAESAVPLAKNRPHDASGTTFIWWRSRQEWAALVENWVDNTAQKGSVFTMFELREGDPVRGQDWRGMPREMFEGVIDELVHRGKAAVFGVEGDEGSGRGVKFFA